jgi:hypothetical protein
MTRDFAAAIRLLDKALQPAASARETREESSAADPTNDKRVFVLITMPGSNRTAVLPLRSDRQDHQQDDEEESGAILVLRKAPVSRLRRLREADRQFVDVGRGIVRVRLPWLHVDRTDVPVPVESFTPQPRAFLDPFGDRASLVSRLLVEQPARSWGAREIAAEAGVSTMTASHVLRQLREIDVVEVKKHGRAFQARLRDLPRLVEYWTRAYEWKRSIVLPVQAPMGSPDRFLRRLTDAFRKHRWALTLQAGASLVAPHASWDTVHLYIDAPDAKALDTIARSAGWEPGPGKLVLMRPWYAHSAWVGMRTIEDIPVVSDLQLVLDLWHYPVRGREQGLELLSKMERDMASRRQAAT